MISITKERLLKLQQWRETYGLGSNVVLPAEEAEGLACIALASLEAEKSILYRERNPYNGLTTGWQELTVDEYEFIRDNAGENAEFRTVYTAPPAPVSVPDEMTMQKALSAIDQLSWQECTRDAYMLGWNACRAAMLQGAENAESRCTIQAAPVLDSSPENAESRCSNSPVIPDGWVACSERMPEETGDIIVVSDGIVMSGVSYSRKKGFYLQALEYDADEPVDDVTHWIPLPAPPQQEVK